MVHGEVESWDDEQGWGVLRSPETPGGCWAHFSAVDSTGYRGLVVGDKVEFDVERLGPGSEQDGFSFRATTVKKSAA